jgi:hypothetical protein
MILNDANRNYKCPSVFDVGRQVSCLIYIKLYTIIAIGSMLDITRVGASLAAIAPQARYH